MAFLQHFWDVLSEILAGLAIELRITLPLLLHFLAALCFTKTRPRFTASNLLLFTSPMAVLILATIGMSSRPQQLSDQAFSIFAWTLILLQIVHAAVIIFSTKASKWVSIAFALLLIWINLGSIFVAAVLLFGK